MHPVAKFSSPDGKKQVTVYARTDGLYEFREEALTTVDHPMGAEDVWLPAYSSGLFATLGEAQDAALGALAWLGDL